MRGYCMKNMNEECEIRIRKLKARILKKRGSKVRKKEQAYEEEKYFAARRYMLSIPFVDEDDYNPLEDIIAQAITFDLPIKEPDNSLNMGDEHLDTILTTESDEVIKSSVENLVPIPSDSELFVESLINRDTSIDYSSKIDPIFKEFAGELAHIAPIPPGIVEADFDSNDDTSSDDDVFMRTIEEMEKVVVPNLKEDNSSHLSFRTFLPFITYPEVSPLSSFIGSEDMIFDPGILA
ncbi:hypothetical protein Tco_0398114 [Tanacetum coccineum]